MKTRKVFAILLTSSFLIINSSYAAVGSKYPKSAQDLRNERVGSVLNNSDGSSGFNLFGKNDKEESSGGYKGLGVNAFLWKASLEVIGFMPIAVSDSSGGVITTEWLEDLDHPGERYKVNILIQDTSLNVQALKVSVFKQRLADSIWRDTKPAEEIREDIEDKIFTRARSLKISQENAG
jgi:hypothetical protein